MAPAYTVAAHFHVRADAIDVMKQVIDEVTSCGGCLRILGPAFRWSFDMGHSAFCDTKPGHCLEHFSTIALVWQSEALCVTRITR